MRALFEICLFKGWPLMCARVHRLALMIENQVWSHQTPLWQVANFSKFDMNILTKLDRVTHVFNVDMIRNSDYNEVKAMCPMHHNDFLALKKLSAL